MAMCMPSGSFMGYENWEETLHQKFLEEEHDGYLSAAPKALIQDTNGQTTEFFGGYTHKKREQDDGKIAELQAKIDQLEKCESVSEFYIENMRGALAGIKDGDINSAMRFLIAALLEPNENRPDQEAVGA